MDTPICRHCGVVLKTKNWYTSAKVKNWRICKKCQGVRNQSWKLANYDRYRENWNLWYAEKGRFKRYKLTPEMFLYIEEKQQGVCAICKQPESMPNKSRLCIDHDHVTNQVRGLLCNKCNVGLANFRDNIQYLTNAVEYLQKHEENQ